MGIVLYFVFHWHCCCPCDPLLGYARIQSENESIRQMQYTRRRLIAPLRKGFAKMLSLGRNDAGVGCVIDIGRAGPWALENRSGHWVGGTERPERSGSYRCSPSRREVRWEMRSGGRGKLSRGFSHRLFFSCYLQAARSAYCRISRNDKLRKAFALLRR
jgi:hypothetical protein